MHGTIEQAFRVEWQPLAALTSIAADWRALAARALEPNVFYEPAFALAAAPVFGRDVGAGLVWSRATPPRLLGLFPARIERWRCGVPVLVGWTHPYAPLGAPLVDRDAGAAVVDAWLDHLAGRHASREQRLPRLLLLPLFPEDGALAQAFTTALKRHGGRCVAFARHQRAILAPEGERAGTIEQALGHKKFKELRRQRRRLGEQGQLVSRLVSDPAAVAGALGDFLALEAGGWKGRAGTAIATNAAIRTFVEAAVTQLAGEGKVGIGRLDLDGRAIAATILLRSGGTAWSWKIAYDESVARASPGMQLLLDVTQALLDDPEVMCADSCAIPNHPMIDHVWRERRTLADRLVLVGAGAGAGFALVRALEHVRRGAITTARQLRARLRR